MGQDKFFEFQSGKGEIATGSSRLLSPREFAMVMIGTGLVALALSTIDYRRNMKRIDAEYGPSERSVAMVTAVIVSGMGLVAFVVALVRG